MTISAAIKSFLVLTVLLFLIPLSSCSTINAIPPEINLMRVDVQDATLSHVQTQRVEQFVILFLFAKCCNQTIDRRFRAAARLQFVQL